MKDVAIIGGGLAGLINAIQLAQAGLRVTLIEKKQYPYHKVCGEYISHEVTPYLKSIDAFPNHVNIAQLNRFLLTTTSGKSAELKLELGGFGISRYQLDSFLAKKAQEAGLELILSTTVTSVDFEQDTFLLNLNQGSPVAARLVIGSYGKRSKLDKLWKRSFMQKRSPYLGVKYHAKLPMDPDLIALHIFSGGYCGVSRIEEGKVNICYLSQRDNLKRYGDINTMEKEILLQNPYLRDIFQQAEFLFDKPEVINEISFAPKKAVENHILMSGDAAGLITPLCGNGMAMAIHSAKILSDTILRNYKSGNLQRDTMENEYQKQWSSLFARRLQAGRWIQRLFHQPGSIQMLMTIATHWPGLAQTLIKQTHGKPF
ncbi:MAG: NAD(P)/FAD-dependent oxidoreductase [Cyclobacteriaceae bacterium]